MLLVLSSCGQSQTVSTEVGCFEDFVESLEDPSINQQNEQIKKNRIKRCSIIKWEHSPNNDTLEIQSDSTVIYYNNFGGIDSTITYGYQSKKVLNFYNNDQKLEKRLIITNGYGVTDGVYRKQIDTTTYLLHYDDEILSKEIINSQEAGIIEISYQWSNKELEQIEVLLKKNNNLLTYQFIYKDGIMVKRKTSISNNAPLQNKTNDFVYGDNRLIEITNTWMIANDSISETMKFSSQKEKEEFSNVTNTKFEYYDDGQIKLLQKVYGIWLGESFWVTMFSYLENGLIKEKEMNNDGEFGHHKIIYKYKYEKQSR
ncbi:MAG: hypothetical protein MJK07_23225 [Flavobacteriales bacterium]|nr:hypothetical protein [Flavobacteriales bacterium]